MAFNVHMYLGRKHIFLLLGFITLIYLRSPELNCKIWFPRSILPFCTCCLSHLCSFLWLKRVSVYIYTVFYTYLCNYLCSCSLFFMWNWITTFNRILFCLKILFLIQQICRWQVLSVFIYLEMSLFLFHVGRLVLLDLEFLADSLFLSALWACYSSFFWPLQFPMRSCC